MCFSAEADLAAGAVVTVIGVDALRHVRRPADVALAALPLVLGVHLLVEVAVWRNLEGAADDASASLAEWVYLVIAFGVVPVLAPTAIALWDAPARRRLWPFVALGLAVGGVLLAWQVADPASARIDGNHIEYVVRFGTAGGLAWAVYVVATCGPALLSSDRSVRTFGALNLVAVGVLAGVEREGLVSLWCAWAAVTSVVIAARLRSPERPGDPEPVVAAPARGAPGVASG